MGSQPEEDRKDPNSGIDGWISLFGSRFNSRKGASVCPPLAEEGGTPEVIRGKEIRVLACRGADAGSQEQRTFPAEMIHPSGGLHRDTPSSIRSEVVSYVAVRVATTFFSFWLFWKHSLGFFPSLVFFMFP